MSAAQLKLSPSTKGGVALYAAMWAAMSVGVHAVLYLLGFLGLFGNGAGLLGGGGAGAGDGFAGNSVEVEIAGPESLLPAGAESIGHDNEPPAPEVPPAQPEVPSEHAVLDLDGDVEVPARRELPRPEQPAPQRERRAARELAQRGDPNAPEVAAPGMNERPAGTGGDDSTAGAPGGDAREVILGAAGALGDTMTGRRALLPNGGMCEDPVAGTWRSQKYRSGEWVRFTLHIERQGDEVTGTILSRIWTGTPADPRPGRCTAYGFDHTWRMEARGRLEGTQLTFESTRYRLVRQDCPSSNATYAPDRFNGTVDSMRDTYQALNNDGAYDIDEPYTFRRVSCE